MIKQLVTPSWAAPVHVSRHHGAYTAGRLQALHLGFCTLLAAVDRLLVANRPCCCGVALLHVKALLLLLLLLLPAAGDVLLVGIDRRNSPAQVEAAYNDTSGGLKLRYAAYRLLHTHYEAELRVLDHPAVAACPHTQLTRQLTVGENSCACRPHRMLSSNSMWFCSVGPGQHLGSPARRARCTVCMPPLSSTAITNYCCRRHTRVHPQRTHPLPAPAGQPDAPGPHIQLLQQQWRQQQRRRQQQRQQQQLGPCCLLLLLPLQ
jgi:hypothetical protein